MHGTRKTGKTGAPHGNNHHGTLDYTGRYRGFHARKNLTYGTYITVWWALEKSLVFYAL